MKIHNTSNALGKGDGSNSNLFGGVPEVQKFAQRGHGVYSLLEKV